MTQEDFEYEISIMQIGLEEALRAFARGNKDLAEEQLDTSIFIGKNIIKMFPEKVK